MTDTDTPEDAGRHELAPIADVEEGFVRLPLGEGEFKDFVRSLLGSPQSITGQVVGPFQITRDDIRNLNALLQQRVTQQNTGVLANFTVRLVFSDHSSVELNSIDELMAYNEVRQVASVDVHLSWDFVVRFPDKAAPEKQRVQVSIVSSGRVPVIDGEAPFTMHPVFSTMPPFALPGGIFYRIEHTARTWGADIDALLQNHLNGLLDHEASWKKLVRKHAGKLSFSVATLFFLSGLVGAIFAIRRFSAARLAEVQDRFAEMEAAGSGVAEQVRTVGEILAGGAWSQFYVGMGVGILTFLFLAIWLGVWIGTTTETVEPSFVLLTKEAIARKERVLKRNNKKWLSFMAALVTSVVASFVANWIFASFWP